MATSWLELLKEASRLAPWPEKVSVPVAVMLAAVRLPLKRPLPWTERLVEGDVVPMPVNPPLVTRKFVAVDEPMAKAGPAVPV